MPDQRAVEAFGDRWTLIALRDIVFGDKHYFRELHAGSLEGIDSNILADRRSLAAHFPKSTARNVQCQHGHYAVIVETGSGLSVKEYADNG